MKVSKLFILLGLILISLILRISELQSVPSSLYYDEVDLGLQARSFVQTHKDYYGQFSPFYFHSFVDAKTPLPILLSVPATIIFSQPELQVRITPALMGVISVVLAFYLTWVLTKNLLAATLVGLTFATNPWQIQFSRIAFESIFSGVFYLASMLLFYLALNQRKLWLLILSTIFFALTFYTYRTMSLFTPITLLILLVVYFHDLLKFKIRNLVICLVIFLGLTVPFLYATTIVSPDLPRFDIVSIFSNKVDPIQIQRDRELDSGDFQNHTLGKQASKTSYLFHNKILSWSHDFFSNWLYTYSTDFLFLKGAPNQRESVGQMGELFYIDLIPLLFGLFLVGKNLKDKKYQTLLALFLTAPIPSSLTLDGVGHGSRLFIFSIPLLIIVGLGWWKLVEFLKKLKFSKLFLTVIGLLWLGCFIFYLHNYYVEFPVLSAPYYSYGFKQMVADVDQQKNNYQYVYISPNNSPPILFYIFWSNTPVSQLQQYGSRFDVGRNLDQPLDKIKVTGIPSTSNLTDLLNILDPHVLYVETPKDLPSVKSRSDFPSGFNVVDFITYPDDTPAFFIFAVDKNYHQPKRS